MKSVITKSRLKNFLTMTATFACLSAPAFAKKQFEVPAERDAYKAACANPGNKFIDALRNEPEAQEFLRLLAATAKSPYHVSELDASIFCHVAIVPNNAALKNIEVTDQNRDALAILLRSHFIGATKLEDSDFSQSGTILRSWSGGILKLSRSENGSMTVNGIAVTSGTLNTPGHAVLVVSDVLPEIPEPFTSAVESFKGSVGVTYVYPVLKNITGKAELTFNEIANFCGFEERLKAGNVTILLPSKIKQIATPILRDLFASDKDFVCRAFTSNVIEGRYTSNELKQIAKTVSGKVSSIDGREFGVSYLDYGVYAYVQIGDQVSSRLRGNFFAGGTGEIVLERHTASYTIIETEDLVSLD
jgi:uncharacterized surface protein with fasciclin (FAS1) repeats